MLSLTKIANQIRVFGGSQVLKTFASQRVTNLERDQENVNSVRRMSGKSFNVPPSAEFVARVSGIATMCKLPFQQTADGLDAAFVGVPIDTGTSNRPGARYSNACNIVMHVLYICIGFLSHT